MCIVCVLTCFLLGVKKSFGYAQIGLLQRLNSKFLTIIPTPFIYGVPPWGLVMAFSGRTMVRDQGSLKCIQSGQKKLNLIVITAKFLGTDTIIVTNQVWHLRTFVKPENIDLMLRKCNNYFKENNFCKATCKVQNTLFLTLFQLSKNTGQYKLSSQKHELNPLNPKIKI